MTFDEDVKSVGDGGGSEDFWVAGSDGFVEEKAVGDVGAGAVEDAAGLCLRPKVVGGERVENAEVVGCGDEGYFFLPSHAEAGFIFFEFDCVELRGSYGLTDVAGDVSAAEKTHGCGAATACVESKSSWRTLTHERWVDESVGGDGLGEGLKVAEGSARAAGLVQ